MLSVLASYWLFWNGDHCPDKWTFLVKMGLTVVLIFAIKNPKGSLQCTWGWMGSTCQGPVARVNRMHWQVLRRCQSHHMRREVVPSPATGSAASLGNGSSHPQLLGSLQPLDRCKAFPLITVPIWERVAFFSSLEVTLPPRKRKRVFWRGWCYLRL